MAYSRTRRTSRSKSARRASARTAGRSYGRRTASRRSNARRSTVARTVKIVIEQAPANQVQRPPIGMAPAATPKKATF